MPNVQMLRIATGLLLAVLVPTCIADDLKGISIGMSFDEAKQSLGKRPRPFCREQQAPTWYDDTCLVKTTFGGVAAQAFIAGRAGRVENISFTFDSSDFDVIAAGLRQKFGAPHDESMRELTTRMGVKAASQRLVWMLDSGQLTAHERVGRIDEGGVFLISHDAIKAEPDGKAAASDM